MVEVNQETILEIISGDLSPDEETRKEIERIINLKPNFYSDLIYSFTFERFNEDEARKIWYEILAHKYEMSKRMGRNVGIRVATLDYLENIMGRLKHPIIIDDEALSKTLKLATSDPLTGLYNRIELFNRLHSFIRSCQKGCVAMLDLDGFKDYNDTYGHQSGDIVLQEFSKILVEELKYVFVARYGGDEFVAIYEDLSAEDVKPQLNLLREKVSKLLGQFGITLSCGIAEYPTDGKTPSELITSADEVLFVAKEFGKNKIACFKTVEFQYEPMDEKVLSVSCVGDFNRWDRHANEMKYMADKKVWMTTLRLKPGRYRYKFLINNNTWVADRKATEFADDGFGGLTSVIKVPL